MGKIKLFLFILISLFFFHAGTPYASDSIKVLIVNEAYPHIPSKHEKIEHLGNMKGDLLVMGTRYSGNIYVWKGINGLYLVNELPLEDYIKDVVAVEVSTDWDMEALKAQAVISRTYALYQKKVSGDSIYHIASSVLHQVYKGNNPDIRVSYAVESTSGEVLTYKSTPIEAFYHSTCGGATENPDEVFGKKYPYLHSVKSDCDLSPYSHWERSMHVSEIEEAMHLRGIIDITVKSYTSSHRVKQLDIITSTGTTTVNATDFRKAIGWKRLPSTQFQMSLKDDMVILEGSGYGHGVGLCQWCALKMAKAGKNYKEILSYFYPGTTIRLYEGL